jgi:protein SCO1
MNEAVQLQQNNTIEGFPFAADAPEETIAAFIDAVDGEELSYNLLVSLLPQQHAIYKNRGGNQVIRLRGYMLAAFARTGLPEEAIPFVLEELENSLSAYMVAAAAIAARSMPAPRSYLSTYLLKAMNNMLHGDDAVSFETYKPSWPLKHYTTALQEIFTTFEWMGAQATTALPQLRELSGASFGTTVKTAFEKAIHSIEKDSDAIAIDDCCTFPLQNNNSVAKKNRQQFLQFKKTILEDQEGDSFTANEFFTGMPSIVVFFYTRCANPNKCSLTVSKLADLQQQLNKEGFADSIRTAAITYDPGFDHAERLKAYGESRRFLFNGQNRALRVKEDGFGMLQDYFDTGVNFSGTIVNEHRIELFILNANGKIVQSFTQLQWNTTEVINCAKKLIPGPVTTITRKIKSGFVRAGAILGAVLPPFLLAFFPKCPVCWATYMSVFGVAGIQSIPYSPWLKFVFIGIMIVNLLLLYQKRHRNHTLLPFWLSVAGFSCIGLAMLTEQKLYSYAGLIFIFSGSLLNSFFMRRKLIVG